MKSIVIINQKGGVGKTTTALNLGIGLAVRGLRVLFIDLDGQGNLSYSLNHDERKASVLDLLTYKAKISDVIQHVEKSDLISADAALTGADNIITTTGKEYRLKEALDSISEEYKYAVIDTPPALGILTVNALTAASEAIITTQADIFSLHGIAQVNESINAVRQYCNKHLKIAGILLTRYNYRTVLSRHITETLSKTAKELNTKLYKSKIRESISIKEAQAARKDIYSYAHTSNGALDYMEFTKEFLKQEG
jgi:chromosome partitioning protein